MAPSRERPIRGGVTHQRRSTVGRRYLGKGENLQRRLKQYARFGRGDRRALGVAAPDTMPDVLNTVLAWLDEDHPPFEPAPIQEGLR